MVNGAKRNACSPVRFRSGQRNDRNLLVHSMYGSCDVEESDTHLYLSKRFAHSVRLSNGIQSLIFMALAPRRLMVGVELHSSFAIICPELLEIIVSFFFGVLIVNISCPFGSRTDVFNVDEEGDVHWKTGRWGTG